MPLVKLLATTELFGYSRSRRAIHSPDAKYQTGAEFDFSRIYHSLMGGSYGD
jgi:hypothetical protein